MKRLIPVVVFIALFITVVTACSGTNHDTINPKNDIQVSWWRIETPPSFTTLMFACFGVDGMVMDQQDGSVSTIPNDPMCPKNGTPYRLVHRFASNAPQIIATLYGPPDNG